jgi:predicted nuclease of predicted toxin-antitoxin system
VKFLVDAQLPLTLARLLTAAGHDVVHSSQLPDGNRTPDSVLASLADADDRIVVTKDRDFEVSHLVRREPARLLLVTTGNIANTNLVDLVSRNVGVIEGAFDGADFVELSSTAVIIRGPADGR